MGVFLEKGRMWERRYSAVLSVAYGFRRIETTDDEDINGHIDDAFTHEEINFRFTVDVKGPKHFKRGDVEFDSGVFWVEFRRAIRDGDDIPKEARETPGEYALEPNNGWLYGDEDFVAFIPERTDVIYTIDREALMRYSEKKVEENGLKTVYSIDDLADDGTGRPLLHTLYTRKGRHDLVALLGRDEIEMLAERYGFKTEQAGLRTDGKKLPIPEYLKNYKRKKRRKTEKNYYAQITQEGVKDGAGEENGIPAVGCTKNNSKPIKSNYMDKSKKLSPSDIFAEMWERDGKAAEAEKLAKEEWDEFLAPKKHESLTDFIRKIFGKTDKPWDDMTPYEKQRNAFMINRIMAIQFPTSANSLNAVKTDGYSVTEVWRHKVGKLFTRVPDWAYTRTGKSETDKTLSKFKKDTLLHYCKVHECGMRELKEQYKFNPTIVDDLKYIETNIINTKDNEQED